MALQIGIGAHLAIFGDGESKNIVLDLRSTLFRLEDRYDFLPILPDSIVSVRIGGPNISPEITNQIDGKLYGTYLVLFFKTPLLLNKDPYTVEIVFGYLGVELPTIEAEVEPNG